MRWPPKPKIPGSNPGTSATLLVMQCGKLSFHFHREARAKVNDRLSVFGGQDRERRKRFRDWQETLIARPLWKRVRA